MNIYNIKTVLNKIWDGDVTYDELKSKLSKQELKDLDTALNNNYIMHYIKENGVPFPGDDFEWDELVDANPGLQILQNFINFMD